MLHRAVYARVMKCYCDGVGIPLTVSTTIDVPAGSGLGASSALVVALIEAFRSALQLPLGEYDVARLAFQIERVDLSASREGVRISTPPRSAKFALLSGKIRQAAEILGHS